VYKFDLKNITDIFSTPKNLGRNKWYFSVFGDVQTSEDYLHILQLRAQNKWIKKYWNDLLDKTTKTKDFHIISLQDKYKVDFFQKKSELDIKGSLNTHSYPISNISQYSNVIDDMLHDALIKRNPQGGLVQDPNKDIRHEYLSWWKPEVELAGPIFKKEMDRVLGLEVIQDGRFKKLNMNIKKNNNSYAISKSRKTIVEQDGNTKLYTVHHIKDEVTEENMNKEVYEFYTSFARDALIWDSKLNPKQLDLSFFKFQKWGKALVLNRNKFNNMLLSANQLDSSLVSREVPSRKFFYQNSLSNHVLNNNNINKYTHIFFNKESKYFKKLNYTIINHSDFSDETRILKKSTGKSLPVRCIKFPIQENSNPTELLRFRFNSPESHLQHKPISNTSYLTLKQKRYNVRNKINPIKLSSNNYLRKYNYSGNPFLKDFSIIEENFSTPTKQYRMFKKAKSRLETSSINTWNRLLRAKRVLVLPAHVNITAITNSYDIIHSW
jgi:hypothetical protein